MSYIYIYTHYGNLYYIGETVLVTMYENYGNVI